MGEPPALPGATQVTNAAWSAAVAATCVGIPGGSIPGSRMLLLTGENPLSPLPLMADTRNVYVGPTARGPTVSVVAGKPPTGADTILSDRKLPFEKVRTR